MIWFRFAKNQVIVITLFSVNRDLTVTETSTALVKFYLEIASKAFLNRKKIL